MCSLVLEVEMIGLVAPTFLTNVYFTKNRCPAGQMYAQYCRIAQRNKLVESWGTLKGSHFYRGTSLTPNLSNATDSWLVTIQVWKKSFVCLSKVIQFKQII